MSGGDSQFPYKGADSVILGSLDPDFDFLSEGQDPLQTRDKNGAINASQFGQNLPQGLSIDGYTSFQDPSRPNNTSALMGRQQDLAALNLPVFDVEEFRQSWQEEQQQHPNEHVNNNKQETLTVGYKQRTFSDSNCGSEHASSVYYSPNVNPQSVALSPAVSHLTIGNEDVDDLESIYSDSSNMLLPVNSLGFKYVNGLEDIENILQLTSNNTDYDLGNSNEQDIYVPHANCFPPDLHISATKDSPSTHSSFQEDIIHKNNTPLISIQEYQDSGQDTIIPQTIMTPHEQFSGLSPLSNTSAEFHNDVKLEEHSNLLSTEADVIESSNSRTGRVSKRRVSSSSRNSSTSRSRRMSPESKARSLSENRDKLLEMADLVPKGKNEQITSPTLNTLSPPTDSTNRTLSLEDGETLQNLSGMTKRRLPQKRQAVYACELCDKRFTRPYNLKSHLRTHTNEKPFICSFCGKAFARQHDRKRHEDLHSGKKRYVCGGKLCDGTPWGCGKKFARSDALGRHFKTGSGKKCITPLYNEAVSEQKLKNGDGHEVLSLNAFLQQSYAPSFENTQE